MGNFEYDYDIDNDSLFLFDKKGKSKGSVEFGDLIFDFDNTQNIVGIEILNATNFLNNVIEEPIAKEILLNLKNCEVNVTLNKNYFIVFIFLYTEKRVVQFPMPIPNINYTSPALVYA